MGYEIIFAPAFKRDLKNLDNETKERLAAALERLATEPYLGKGLTGSLKGLFSLRIGIYRLLYSIIEGKKQLLLYEFGKRDSVYK